MKKLILSILIVFSMASNALATTYYWGTDGSAKGSVTVSYSGVDDVIGVYVLNNRTMKNMDKSGDFTPHMEDRWNNTPASGTFDVSSHLALGPNYVLVFAQNLVFNGFFGGKFSYSYSLNIGNKTIHSDSQTIRNNTRFLGHLAVIFINKNKDGSLTYRELDDSEQAEMTEVGMNINNYYGNQAADIDWGGAIKELNNVKM